MGVGIQRAAAPGQAACPGSDPEIAQAWEEYQRRRYADTRVIMESFAHLLRPGMTVERATEIHWAVTNERTGDMLLVGRQWSHEEFADWLCDAIDRLLLR
jgi:hypothetical protein